MLREKLADHPKIDARLQTTVQEFRGNGHLESVVVKDLATGETEELRPGGVFIFIGLDPNTDFLNGTVDRDRWNFVTTGPTLSPACPECLRRAMPALAAPSRWPPPWVRALPPP